MQSVHSVHTLPEDVASQMEAMVSKRLENIWRMLSRSTLKKAVPSNKVIL